MINSSRSDAAGWMYEPSTEVDGIKKMPSARRTKRHLASTLLLFSLKKDPPNHRKILELPSGGSCGLIQAFV
jgi:hypothetical protein